MRRNGIILLIFACATILPSLNHAEAARKPKTPVIFSFDRPSPAKTWTGDYHTIDLDAATIMEIGPRKLSYPPAKVDVFDPEVIDYWHKHGKLIVRRCYALRFDEKGRKSGFCTLDELIERWSNTMDEPGIDGIAIDEFHSHDAFFDTWMKSFNVTLFETWTAALKHIRERYPDKLIMVWMWGWGEHSKPILESIRDYADFFMPEIYYSEKDAGGFPNFGFPRFRESVDHFENLAPGISQKILIGLGCHEGLYDTDPSIDYGDFIEAQVTTIVNDPVLRKLPGLALYKPSALSPENLARLNGLLKKYYPEK